MKKRYVIFFSRSNDYAYFYKKGTEGTWPYGACVGACNMNPIKFIFCKV